MCVGWCVQCMCVGWCVQCMCVGWCVQCMCVGWCVQCMCVGWCTDAHAHAAPLPPLALQPATLFDITSISPSLSHTHIHTHTHTHTHIHTHTLLPSLSLSPPCCCPPSLYTQTAMLCDGLKLRLEEVQGQHR